MDFVLPISEVFNDGVASASVNTEGVSAALAPEAVITATTDKEIVAATAIEPVVAVLTIEGVGSVVAGDLVITGAGVDIFDGDQPVFAITSVLILGGGEFDGVVA